MKKYGFDGIRLQKRKQLMDMGVDPYPYNYDEFTTIDTIRAHGESIELNEEGDDKVFTTVGRLWSKRKMGKSVFIDLRDKTGKIQGLIAREGIDAQYWSMLSALDLGDIVGVHGKLFMTKTGEMTLRISKIDVLSKTVVPIPMGKETDDKVFNRVADPEAKYRERYIDWMLNDEDRNRVFKRAKIVSAVRDFMESRDFIEVTTPTIEFVYGGAEARPFETSIWALGNSPAFLRISPELYLKRFIVAGFDRVYTICQNFRNEGIDYTHNPEFTMIEWYETYSDYEDQMRNFENLVSSVCQKVNGTMKVSYQGQDIDFTPPWNRMTVLEALKNIAGIDADKMSLEDLIEEMKKHEMKVEKGLTWGVAVMVLFEALCEEALIQPTFIINHPVDISPLTKKKRGDDRFVERFEPYVCGMELGNAYSEMTDPVLQLERLETQREPKEGQDYSDHPVDVDFVRAIGCGMPPTGGVGIGIDRLVMLLTDSPNIRDIIPFPMYKPKK